MKRSERSGFTRYKSAPPCLPTGTDREVLAGWVVACVEHARAAAGGQVVKIKDGIVNLQAFIMIRRAGEPGFAPSTLRRAVPIGSRLSNHAKGIGSSPCRTCRISANCNVA